MGLSSAQTNRNGIDNDTNTTSGFDQSLYTLDNEVRQINKPRHAAATLSGNFNYHFSALRDQGGQRQAGNHMATA